MKGTPITPSEFVALANQTFDYAYPVVVVIGELSNFKVSRGKWLYADIKDDESKLRCFGTVYQLPGPLEDGMMIEMTASPKLHAQFGFSLNIQSIRPVGEGSIKKAANLLYEKLEKEGLFAPERKRYIQRAPARIGLIASEQSAGYADFMKILNVRWQGVEVNLHDVLVQGDSAPADIVSAIDYFNKLSDPPEVLVIVRGGGSVDDLSAFSTEQVTRAVSASRIPTLVAIGHEVDTSTAELAADLRASTPSNAAELLFPDKNEELSKIKMQLNNLQSSVIGKLDYKNLNLEDTRALMKNSVNRVLEEKTIHLQNSESIIESIHPKSVLRRGYAILQKNGKLVSSISAIETGDNLDIDLKDGKITAKVTNK